MELTDKSPMPFGRHRGRAMERVPANYLLWLADELGPEPETIARGAVRRYVDRNREALEKEVLDALGESGPD